MIQPMKKVILLTLESFKKETITQLAELGVMHVESRNRATSELAIASEDKKHLEEALAALESAKVSVTTIMDKSPLFGQDLAKSILLSASTIKEATEAKLLLLEEREGLAVWGDFKIEEWRELQRETGAQLVEVPLSDRASLTSRKDLTVFWIGAPQKTLFWVPALAIPTSRSFDWTSENWTLFTPENDLAGLGEKIVHLNKEILLAQTEIKDANKYKSEIKRTLEEQNHRVLFESVLAQGCLVDGVMYWEGFILEDSVVAFKEWARRHGWAYSLSTPSAYEAVPTQLKMNSVTHMLSPLYNLLGTFPGYRERDISVPFLLFFLIFVALLIGDAGYGLIYLLAGLGSLTADLIRRKGVGDITKLTLSLGTVITIWGALTGNWFGSRLVQVVPSLKDVMIPALFDGNPGSQKLIIFMVLLLGFLQIVLAHVWNFTWELRTGKGLRSIAQLGWLMIVSAVGWLVLNLVVDGDKYPMSHFLLILAGVGFLVVLVFGNQGKGISFIKGALMGFGGIMQTALGCIGAFSDIVSYIRLFAVGLSGVAIADSFNGLGIGLFQSGVAGIAGGIVVILLGHAMCLALGMLSMIVHGIRLNLLEFSSHLGQEWSGQLYKPFGKKN